MLDCSKCVWKNPETCRACRAEEREQGAKTMTEAVVTITGTPQEVLNCLIAEFGSDCWVKDVEQRLKVLNAMLCGHIENHDI